jgi:hypothetical protein
MLVLALLLAQAVTPAAAPAATPAPTPVPSPRPVPVLGRFGDPARAKTLAAYAAEMKAKGTTPRPVTFDDVRTVDPADDGEAAPAASATHPGKAGKTSTGAKVSDEAAAAATAQRRMDRAVDRGLSVPERTSSSRRDQARREWDEAAEACRRTPGCVPQFRDDVRFGENKPLRTDQELIEDVRKRGFSEPHPLPK